METKIITGLGISINEEEDTVIISLFDNGPPNPETKEPEPEPYQKIFTNISSYKNFIQLLVQLSFEVQAGSGIDLNLSNIQLSKDGECDEQKDSRVDD